MLIGWGVFAASQCLLLFAPYGASIPLLISSVALEAIAVSMLSPLTDSLLFINADPEERARILGLIYGLMVMAATAFPAVAGWFSKLSLAAPFWINLIMLLVGAILTVALWRKTQNDTPAGEA